MINKLIVPITRNNKWFSNEDFELEVNMGREAIEGDGNFTVILYRVNRELTEYDNVYNEASKDGIRFFPPMELKVIPIINEQENKAMNPSAGSLRYAQGGPLVFGIYTAQLDELQTNISYGDYIAYPVTETQIVYYTVSDDGIMNVDNKHTIMGFKPAFRTIKCSITDANEFMGV